SAHGWPSGAPSIVPDPLFTSAADLVCLEEGRSISRVRRRAIIATAILPLQPPGRTVIAPVHVEGDEHTRAWCPLGHGLAPGHVCYGCGRYDVRTTGTAPHKCADRQRAAALALPQREKFGVDNVVGAGISAGAESDRTAYPRSGV